MSYPKRFHGCIASKSGMGACSPTYYGGRFCPKHGYYYYNGYLSKEGKKIKDPLKPKFLYTKCVARHSGTPCSKNYRSGKFCAKHMAQKLRGNLDDRGRVVRSVVQHPRKYSGCICYGRKDVDPCGTYKNGRFCSVHNNQYYAKNKIIDWNGNPIRKRRVIAIPQCVAKGKPGNVTCRGRKYGRFCMIHAAHHRYGVIDNDGNRIRRTLREIPCGVPGCHNRGGWKTGLCRMHYSMIAEGNYSRIPSLVKAPEAVSMKTEELGWWEDISKVT